MELLSAYVNTIVLAVAGILLSFYLRGRFEQMDHRFDELRREIAFLRTDVDRKFELAMKEIRGVRSDLTHVALAVGARARPEPSGA